MNQTNDRIEVSRTRLFTGLSYLIAIATMLAGPAVVAATFGLALIAGDAAFAGLGLIAGALMAASGAVLTVWCLARSKRVAA